jgi:hypothetical protein
VFIAGNGSVARTLSSTAGGKCDREWEEFPLAFMKRVLGIIDVEKWGE